MERCKKAWGEGGREGGWGTGEEEDMNIMVDEEGST